MVPSRNQGISCMARCGGCNVCSQYRAVRVPLTSTHAAYLKQCGAVATFNLEIASVLGVPAARLSAGGLRVARPYHLKQIAAFIPAVDRDRLEARGVAAAMTLALRSSVFAYPRTARDQAALADLEAGVAGFGSSLRRPAADGREVIENSLSEA